MDADGRALDASGADGADVRLVVFVRVAQRVDHGVAQPLPERLVLQLLVRTGEVKVCRLQARHVPLEGEEGEDAGDAGHHGDQARAHGDDNQAHRSSAGHVVHIDANLKEVFHQNNSWNTNVE